MFRLVLAVLAASVSVACAPGERPFRMVQVCVGSDGPSALRDELRAIAADEHMEFGDRSAESARELQSLGRAEESASLLNIAAWREGGPRVSAGNSGMPRNQVVLGFSRPSDPEAAAAFADRVIARMQTRWRVEEVPPGQGAQGMENCPD